MNYFEIQICKYCGSLDGSLDCSTGAYTCSKCGKTTSKAKKISIEAQAHPSSENPFKISGQEPSQKKEDLDLVFGSIQKIRNK